LGFVGAANAIAIATALDENGAPLFEVVGVELPNEIGRERVLALNAGRFPFPTTDPTLTAATRSAAAVGNLRAVTNPAAFAEAAVIVIDVGLDILEKKGQRPRINLPPFVAAISTVAQHMPPDALVLLESTVPPGTCERIVVPILKEKLADRGLPQDRFKLAYCYERVMPGPTYLSSIVDMWRVYAGLTPEAADATHEFLTSFINVADRPLRRLATIRAAELSKVLENTYRAVNIALIDEWEQFARGIGVDLFEVLDAIRVRPTHQNVRYPGLGVGGYCLSKDPLFGFLSAREIYSLPDIDFPLSLASVRINDSMPTVTARELEAVLGGLKGTRILIVGASYRADVADTRFSPSATLAEALIAKGARVEITDPLVEEFPELDIPLHRDFPAPGGWDAVVLAVAHKQFDVLDLVAWARGERPVIFDSNGVLSAAELSRLKDAGFKVSAIGRGGMA
jgi:nucleotide sugar dehydrogenase